MLPEILFVLGDLSLYSNLCLCPIVLCYTIHLVLINCKLVKRKDLNR